VAHTNLFPFKKDDNNNDVDNNKPIKLETKVVMGAKGEAKGICHHIHIPFLTFLMARQINYEPKKFYTS
jgi:hypothetical protein